MPGRVLGTRQWWLEQTQGSVFVGLQSSGWRRTSPVSPSKRAAFVLEGECVLSAGDLPEPVVHAEG